MPKTSQLLLPRPSLSGCIFAAVTRDTRGTRLCDADRFNHFPASPLVALTIQFSGQTYLTNGSLNFKEIYQTQPLGRITVAGPQGEPVTSWNTGEVFVVTVGFYPDAWFKLTKVAPATLGNQLASKVPDALGAILENCCIADDAASFWEEFQNALDPLWLAARKLDGSAERYKNLTINDWAQSLIVRAATSGAGQSLRAIERRLRRWTGQNKQSIAFYAKFDRLHHAVLSEKKPTLAGLAHQAGYADQSHMGRAVRRATGFSPAQLNKLIETNEAFWCYRLLGERF